MQIGTLQKGIGDLQSAAFVQKCTEITPPQFTFWRVLIFILEAKIVLGVLYSQRAENGELDPSWLISRFRGAPIFRPEVPKPFKTSILGPLD